MLKVRRYEEGDAPAIVSLVQRNFREVNIRDYPQAEMEKLAADYTADRVLRMAAGSHMYVVLEGDTLVGTGTISGYYGSKEESILLSIFVLPEYQGRGVGRLIMEALENDEYALNARRIEIPASITGSPFYEKMGYRYKNGVKELDSGNLYRMEKFR